MSLTIQTRLVTWKDLRTARDIISMGRDLGETPPSGARVIQWDGLPSPESDPHAACRLIFDKIAALLIFWPNDEWR